MTATKLLYHDDPLHLEFTAEVIEPLTLPDGRPGAILPATYFYPTGGGQEHDSGRIGEATVLDVIKQDDGRVIHVLDRPLDPGSYPASIDRGRRLRAMQHHTAQHMLSSAFLREIGLMTVSANINGDTPSTIDFETGEISSEDLGRVEQAANAVVFEDREVRWYFVDEQQAAGVPFRRPPKVSGTIRVIEVDGFDHSACGGTHCPRTGMVGMIKIVRTERVNRKLRVHFVAGWQALETARLMQSAAQGAAVLLDSPPEGLVSAVERLRADLDEVRAELTALRAERLKAEARELVASGLRVAKIFRGRPAAEVRALAAELQGIAGVSALLAGWENGKVSLVACCHPASGCDARDLLKQGLAVFGGRGGGDAGMAQGGGALAESDLPRLEAALGKILG